jgi:hypothetical protein
MKTSSLTQSYEEDIKEHRRWLKDFDERRLKKWEDLLQANPEAAICEAKTRILMANYGVDIRPYEDLSEGGPDFWCSKDSRVFYIEATCISIEAATRKSRLCATDNPDVDDSCYEDMTEKFRSEIGGKIKQCHKVEAPHIVVIGTLHPIASACCFDEAAAEELMTATTYITRNINKETGELVGDTYEVTRLDNSVFIRPSKNLTNWIEHARCSVSAVLLCGFGSNPPNVVGCLHPSPRYVFDKTLLPKMEFCRLADEYQKGRLQVEWS